MPSVPADIGSGQKWGRWVTAVALAGGLLAPAAAASAQPLFAQPGSLPPSGELSTPGASLASPDGVPRSIAPPAPNPGARAPAARTGGAGIVPPALGGIAVSARFGRDGAPIPARLHWRVYADKPDQAGAFRLIKEETAPAPTFVLPPGGYIVHVALGFASAAKHVQVQTDTVREVFDLPAGGVRFEGRVGDTPIPAGQISFEIYAGSQFDGGDQKPIASDIPTGSIVLLPEGTYHVVSSYGDGNAVMRYDFRVQSGKLTDARINHRAAVITLKLVSEPGGEALANTAWSVLTPGGDVIKESIGAFPTVVLAEGEYVAIARNEGKVYNREFKVEPGFDREIELLAR
ncbi:MAG: hypothetical protein IRZ09_02400 [Variibacter sp.]|nr:hypothetical protein [Variibacter sp.]